MDSKMRVTLEDGWSHLWKVEADEKPLHALKRFFTALDESLPESRRPVHCLATLEEMKEEKARQLAELKAAVPDGTSEMASRQRLIEERERDLFEWDGITKFWAEYCAARQVIMLEWLQAGLLTGLDYLKLNYELFLFGERWSVNLAKDVHLIREMMKEGMVVDPSSILKDETSAAAAAAATATSGEEKDGETLFRELNEKLFGVGHYM